MCNMRRYCSARAIDMLKLSQWLGTEHIGSYATAKYTKFKPISNEVIRNIKFH